MIVQSKLRTRFLLMSTLLAACVAGLVRAEDKEPAPFTTYIGELKDAPDTARIAIVVEQNKFVAYVCSGDQPFNDAFSRWYRGDVTDGKMSVTLGEVELTAALKDDAITGTLKKGQSHAFTAKAIAGDANAGLFRAADKLGDNDVIFGWIMDEKGTIVGTAGKKNGPVQTLPAPKGGGNVGGLIAGQKVPAGKVTGAANDPKATNKRKFDAAARQEFVNDLVADQKANGGNAVQAMVVQQVRRFVAGKKAETKLEEKVFTALKKAPPGALNQYLKDWDKLPVATRDALLGPAAKQIDVNKALDGAQAKTLVQAMPQVAKLKLGTRPKAQPGTVKGVNITTVKCVDETNPEAFGQDEVFALHAVIVGTAGPVIKQTAVYREFDDGITKLFSATDKVVFPQPGLEPTAGADVMVVTTLFEDDGTVILQVLNTLKPLIEAAALIVLEQVAEAKDIPLDDATKEALKTGIAGVVDGAISALGNLLVQPLGSDAIVVRPNGTVVGTNGAPKTKMTFRKVKNGDVRHEYELTGFQVQ